MKYVITAAVLLFCGVASAFTPSDTNSDGITNAVDLQSTINSVLGIPSSGYIQPDGNHDGTLDAADAQLVINSALGLLHPTSNPILIADFPERMIGKNDAGWMSYKVNRNMYNTVTSVDIFDLSCPTEIKKTTYVAGDLVDRGYITGFDILNRLAFCSSYSFSGGNSVQVYDIADGQALVPITRIDGIMGPDVYKLMTRKFDQGIRLTFVGGGNSPSGYNYNLNYRDLNSSFEVMQSGYLRCFGGVQGPENNSTSNGNYFYNTPARSGSLSVACINEDGAEEVALSALYSIIYSGGSWAVNNEILYQLGTTIDGQKKLVTMDVHDPKNPKVLGIANVDLDASVATPMAASGGYCYINNWIWGDDRKEIVVLNVKNPDHPIEVCRIPTESHSANLTPIGRYLFVGDGDRTKVYDLL